MEFNIFPMITNKLIISNDYVMIIQYTNTHYDVIKDYISYKKQLITIRITKTTTL